MKWHMRILGIFALLALVAAGCGDDSGDDGTGSGSDDSSAANGSADGSSADDSSADDSSADDGSGDDSSGDDSSAADGSTDGTAGGGSGGTLVLGDETIELDSARCYLQEQDSAGGGGKILLTGQGMGTNAAGDEVLVDFARYDEESQFTGDDILVDIGDPFSGDTVTYSFSGEIGAVTLDGSTLSATGITFQNFDDLSEVPGSMQLNC